MLRHTVDDVLEICAKMGDSHGHSAAPLRTHILQGEDLYHFGVFKGAFRVERAEIEAMKQLSSSWFIKRFNNSGVAVSSDSESFGTRLRRHGKALGRSRQSRKDLKCKDWSLLIELHSGKTSRTMNAKEPQRSPPDKKSQVEAAERCVERISIPGAPGLRVIARSSDLTFDMTFDGSPEVVRTSAPEHDEVGRRGNKSLVENPSMNEDHLNVVKQLILEKQENIEEQRDDDPQTEKYMQTRSVR